MIIFMMVLIWLAFGLFTAGFEYAYFQRKWPKLASRDWKRDTQSSISTIFFGPIAFLVACFYFREIFTHGWLFPGTIEKDNENE